MWRKMVDIYEREKATRSKGRRDREKDREVSGPTRVEQKNGVVGGCVGNRLSEVRFHSAEHKGKGHGKRRTRAVEEDGGEEGERLGAPFEGGLLNFQGHSRGPPLQTEPERERETIRGV
ncbi:hypothetical protein WN55_08762 [Dufourea novaeangliae]|uniref:Uncharacterized protein n=1 Tax=Dufourea novaeangliae TaxID=178035 RepID=A0A154NZR0_DUFNO|nr:hypothetical protein WN55_08762 [Dufourea novaeangliae]